jgi:hypothetical protein
MTHSNTTKDKAPDPFTTDIAPPTKTWSDEPLIPIDPAFNTHFQLQIDKNEFQGMRNFISGYMESKHLDTHQDVLARKLNLIETKHSTIPKQHPYLCNLSKLLKKYGAPDLLESLKLTREERKETIRQLADHSYLKHELSDGDSVLSKEMRRLIRIDDVFQKCGLSPLKDSMYDINTVTKNVTLGHGYGDFAIVRLGEESKTEGSKTKESKTKESKTKESKLKYLIETKNTMRAMGPNFFSEIHSQEQQSISQNYQYGFLIVWPETESLAEDYLERNGISFVEFNRQYRRWKDRFYCRKVKMPNEVFVAPMHDQDDPIGLFRSRTIHMANAVRKVCKKAYLDFLNEDQKAS